MSTMATSVGDGRMTETVAGDGYLAPMHVHVPYQTHRSNAVIILERDGSLARSGPSVQSPPPTSGYAEFSANLVQEHDNLIDRVLSYAFDTLGLTALEVRVRESE